MGQVLCVGIGGMCKYWNRPHLLGFVRQESHYVIAQKSVFEHEEKQGSVP
jgi:hypothetical protein